MLTCIHRLHTATGRLALEGGVVGEMGNSFGTQGLGTKTSPKNLPFSKFQFSPLSKFFPGGRGGNTNAKKKQKKKLIQAMGEMAFGFSFEHPKWSRNNLGIIFLTRK